MHTFLQSVPSRLAERSKAPPDHLRSLETHGFALTGAARPPLLFEYYNFPPLTYRLRYDAPGGPALAAKASRLLHAADLTDRCAL